jgi:putative nucleotidyltransferase with HDIG domain
MLVAQKNLYRSKLRVLDQYIKPLWNHSLGTALSCRWLAISLGLNKLAEEVFLAGLLHDVGKLLILIVIEDVKNTSTLTEDIPPSVVMDLIDAMHPSQGEKLMRRQNIPDEYCSIVAQHHDAVDSGDSVSLNLVRLANLTCHKMGLGLKHDPDIMLSTTTEATRLMANDIMLAELQVVLEDQIKEIENSLD